MCVPFLPSFGWLAGGEIRGRVFSFFGLRFRKLSINSSTPSSSRSRPLVLAVLLFSSLFLTSSEYRRQRITDEGYRPAIGEARPIELAHRFWCGAIPEVYSEEQEGDSGDSRHCVRSCRRSVDDNCRCTVDPVANKWESKFATLSRFFDFCRGCVTRMAAPSPNLLAKGLPILTPTALNPHAPVGKWILGTSSLVCAMVHIGG